MLGVVLPFPLPCFITRILHSSLFGRKPETATQKKSEREATSKALEGRFLGQKTDGFVFTLVGGKEGKLIWHFVAERKKNTQKNQKGEKKKLPEQQDRHTVNSVTISNRKIWDKSVKIAQLSAVRSLFFCVLAELRGLVMDKRLFGDVLQARLEILS